MGFINQLYAVPWGKRLHRYGNNTVSCLENDLQMVGFPVFRRVHPSVLGKTAEKRGLSENERGNGQA